MDTSGPQCQVCLRTPENKLPFYCYGCARNVLYEPRLEQARMLLEKEALGSEVQAIVNQSHQEDRTSTQSSSAPRNDGAVQRLSFEQINIEIRKSRKQTRDIFDESEVLRNEIKGMRARIAQRRIDLAKRRTALKAAEQGLEEENARMIKPIQEEIEATEASSNRLQARSAEARMFLCREVAALCALDRRKRRKGMLGRDQYSIGGLPIIDLRDLNSVSASFSSIFQ